MSARDVMAKTIVGAEYGLPICLGRAGIDAMLANLTAAGYRILGPDELDPVTASKIADWIEPQRREVPAHGWEFSSAIRSLSPEATQPEAKENHHGE